MNNMTARHLLLMVLMSLTNTFAKADNSEMGDAQWIRSSVQSVSADIKHYSLDWDFYIQRLNAGFLFSGNAAHNTFYMWQVNLSTSGKVLLRPHICLSGTFKLLKEVNITNLVTIHQDENEKHHLHLDINVNVVTTTIDGVVVDTYQVPYSEVSYGEFGIREYGNEACYFDNMLVQDLTDAETPVTLIEEDFETYTALVGGLIVYQANGNGRIGIAGTTNWYKPQDDGIPVFRKSFELGAGVQKAILRASALGIYDVFVNGKRVEGEELKPGWTDYRKEIAYQEFDVTTLLRQGTNAIGAQVSNGWYAGDIAHNAYGSSTHVGFIASLEITLDDGTVQSIVTDCTWKSNTCGPVIKGDIYDGETYDARRSEKWSCADYDDSSWYATALNTDQKGTLFLQTAPNVVVRNDSLWRHPQQVTIYKGTVNTGTTYGAINVVNTYPDFTSSPVTLQKGQTMVVDLGQNMVGWIHFTAKGKEGTTLTWRFAEMLNYNGDAARLDKGPSGSLWTHNLRTADATLKYIMNGNAEGESFHQSTSWMGFRYVELTSDAEVTIEDVVGMVVGSDITEHGEFECSDADINQLYNNTLWGQRGNFMSIPMDCPQRDERLGWTGDTQIFSRTAMYNCDAYDFYRQWMRDMRNGQNESNGAFRDIAPYCVFWGEGNSAWGDAGVIVPWVAYDMTGDKTILEENYEAMKRWMNFCTTQADDTYKYNGAGTSFGDWLSYEDYVNRYVSVTYYAYVARLMQKSALALSANETDAYALDAAKYAELFDNIKAEFQQRYLNVDGTLNVSTQTSYLLALHLGLIPDDKIDVAKEALRNKIINNDYKLSTGFVGTGILTTTLSEIDYDDLAYDLLLQRHNPSWLYSIDQGATTIWERWDSYTIESGFNKHSWNMNSFNHYSYGAVCEWMYATMCGIQTPDYAINTLGESGFEHFVLCPHPDPRNGERPQSQPRITWARAKTTTTKGDISARWDIKQDDRITYTVTVPLGSTATIYMPVLQSDDQVTINGTDSKLFAGATVKGIEQQGSGLYASRLVVEVPSGMYTLDDLHAPTTRVERIEEQMNTATVRYNLSGIRVDDTFSGIVVQDGRKVVQNN